jgi:hypothetical protein
LQLSAFVARFAPWLYALIGLAMLWAARAYWQAEQAVRQSQYGLQRERAAEARALALSVLLTVVSGLGLVMLFSQTIAPGLAALRFHTPTPALVLVTTAPTAAPVVSILLPGQPSPTPSGSATPMPTITPVPPAGSGCRVASATITSPLAGAVISGQVDVRGSANIPDFAFYVLEISTVGDNWLNLYTDDKPVQDSLLGRWNASLYPPGEYAFRMIVYDARGAFPEPCTLPITIGGLP